MRVLVFGTFDRFHPGHRFVLDEAMKRGELYVVIARDTNVQKIKGKTPEQPEEIRKKSVQNAFPDAHVVLGDPKDFLVPVRSVKPNLILLGYDQRLPPGVSESDLGAPIERLPAFKPDQYKSSLRRSD